MFTFINQLARFSRFVLPSQCIMCHSTTANPSSLCHLCHDRLPILQHKCALCAQYFPFDAAEGTLCATCLKNAPPFDQLIAAYPYCEPISHWISKLKFQHELIYADVLGHLLTEKIKTCWQSHRTPPTVILPIPLHQERLQERGFNQAIEIARPISHILNIPLDIAGTRRVKHTTAQTSLSGAERRRNLANAFASSHSYKGKSIAVLDDVITTGQTVYEYCTLLKSQGAESIAVWCCARAF